MSAGTAAAGGDEVVSEMLTVTFKCKPGKATPEFAMECQRRVIELLQAVADEECPGAVTFTPQAMAWIDDGKEEVVVKVAPGGEIGR